MSILKITGLHRDILRKRSFVTEKQLGLPVPLDCTLEQLKSETEKVVRALADELASATVEGPEGRLSWRPLSFQTKRAMSPIGRKQTS
jgi:hypothetical protein